MKAMKIRIMMLMSGFIVLAGSLVYAETINLVGTENGQVVFEKVAEAFEKANPKVQIEIPESIDSGGGIKAVADDKAKIARVARGFTEWEKPYGLTYLSFAKLRIVFFVNKSAGVKSLTAKQIGGIYSGRITDWADAGGSKGKIRVVTREEGDSALETIEENLLGFKDIEITSRSKTVYSEQDAVDIVIRKKGAVGFGSHGIVQFADVDILSIDGISHDAADYPLAHPLGLVFKKENKTGMIGKFIDFATSTQAHDAIKSGGAVPLK